MKEEYLLGSQCLIIRDPELKIDIEEPVSLNLVPEDLEISRIKGLIIKRDAQGHPLQAYFEREGKLYGQYRCYYPEGKVKAECYYEKGDLHGPSRFYSESGHCLSESWFYRNLKQGKSKRYYLSGDLCSIERYKQGRLCQKQEYYYEDGQLKTEMHYIDGVMDGQVSLYWPNGEKKRECLFQRGLRHHWDRIWNTLGLLMEEGEYICGEPVGRHRRWYENGNLEEQKEYYTPNRFDRKEWDMKGNLTYEGSFDQELNYSETVWKEGFKKIRKGKWKDNRIIWEGNVAN